MAAWVVVHHERHRITNTVDPTQQELLARSRLQKPKIKVSTFREFPLTMDFDGLSLCSYFGSCCCLCARFQVLSGTSIMVLVVLGLFVGGWGAITFPSGSMGMNQIMIHLWRGDYIVFLGLVV